jgi:hypothetical protein
MIQLQTWPLHYTVSFSTSVIVDGPLNANDRGLQHVSDVLSESQRTFPVVGTIQADNASDGKLVFYDVTFDPSQCPAGAGVRSVLNFMPARGSNLRLKQ